MSKNFKILIVSVFIFLTLGIELSKVIAVKNNDFFYTNKQEISQGETLEMTLDISKIKYDEFEFKLSSNLDTNNIVISEDIKAENYNNDISINIDKSKTNLEKITFYYQVPENSQIGTKIELIAQIIVGEEKKVEQNVVDTNIANNTDTLANNQVDNNTVNETNTENTETYSNTNESNTTTTEIEYKVMDSKKINVKIVEKKQEDNQEKSKELIDKEKSNTPSEQNKQNSLEKNDKLNINMPNNKTDKTSANMNISTKKNQTMPSNKQTINYSSNSMNLSNMQSQVETAVYKGSNNNYLSKLKIEGEKLNTTFNKENLTYFVQTTGKTKLNLKVTAEDDDAKVYVTGNENLKKGNNKILISVTAENGDVRYYRVFVTNN